MTDQNKTLVAALIDRSGSMYSIKTDTEGGYNQFIQDQLALDGELRVTLSEFDQDYRNVYTNLPGESVEPYVLRTGGTTALLDGMGKLITDTGILLAAMTEDERPGKVIVVILTDGMENASREWTKPAIVDLVTQQTEQYGWEFIFLGANIDAVSVAVDLGMNAGGAMTYGANSKGVSATFDALSTYTTATRSGLAANFSDAERTAASGL